MEKNYTKEEIDEIILSKQMNEFYLAVLKEVKKPLTDKEIDILNPDLDDIFKDILKKSMHYRTPRITVITMIDNYIYDIENMKFIDQDKEKIIDYDNVMNHFNENNCRIKIKSTSKEQLLQGDRALFDFDPDCWYIMDGYVKAYMERRNYEDLTQQFIDEISNKKVKI